MRRTTICRSERVIVAIAAALLVCPVLSAQDTTRVADTTRVVDTTQAAAAPAFGQVPATHTVSRGETLWSISQMYFGDPLLWPEIYRFNTAVVEDPHWIYPGEVLALAPVAAGNVAQGEAAVDTGVVAQGEVGDTVRAAADTMVGADTVAAMDTLPTETPVLAEPPPEPIESYETIFDRERNPTQQVRDALRSYAEQPYRPVRRGEFYAAGFLSEDEKLPWARVIGTTDQPSIARLRARSNTMQFSEVAITPARDASYHVGDSLLLVRIDRTMPRWGDVVVPVGIARVTEVQEKQLLAQLLAQYAQVREGRFALPLEAYRDPGQTRPAAVADGLQGRLIGLRDEQDLSAVQDFAFIDQGRAAGVVPGDMFEIFRPAAGEPGTPSEEVLATLLIVHTRERTATGIVVGTRRGDLKPGLPVRLTRKMPS